MAAEAIAAAPAFERFDFADAGHVANEQLRTLRSMNELLARNLTHALSAWLRTSVTVSAGPQTQQTFQEFVDKTDGCYLLSLQMPEQHASALLRWPLPLAAHLIELLLGGSGGAAAEPRELTEIEDAIFTAVLEVVLREWNAVWSQVGLRFTPGERAQNGGERGLMSPTEKVFCFALPLELGELTGEICLCMAAPVLVSVLRRAQALRKPAHAAGERNFETILSALREARVRTGLSFTPVRVPASRLANLRVGATLVLPLPSNATGELRISDVPVATAAPVRVGERRAVRVSALRERSASALELPALTAKTDMEESAT